MGQIEKIFVISIIVLVSLILGITLFGNSSGKARAAVIPTIDPTPKKEPPLLAEDPLSQLVMENEAAEEKKIKIKPFEVKPDPEPAGEELLTLPEKKSAVTLPKPKSPFPYVMVKKGDTLSQILERVTGSATKHTQEVLSYNEGLNLERLFVGKKIWIPSHLYHPQKATQTGVKAATTLSSPQNVPKKKVAAPRKYRVKKGDSLWKIASSFYGKSSVPMGIKRIKNANAGKDLELLPVDLVLVIP